MGTSKQTKKFVTSGKLKDQIKSRQKSKSIKNKIDVRQKKKQAKLNHKPKRSNNNDDDGENEVDDDDDEVEVDNNVDDNNDDNQPQNVDDILNMNLSEDDDDDDEDDLSEDDNDDDKSDVELDSKSHAEALKNLSKSDPEFFKFLQENDKELLEFSDNDDDEDNVDDEQNEEDKEDEEDEEAQALAEMEGNKSVKKTPTLTKKMLRDWQRSIISNKSIRSFKKLILAFRSAAFSTDVEDIPSKQSMAFAYKIESPDLFNKVILTTFKFTPLVLKHHWSCKELENGRFKLNNCTNSTLPKLISTYLNSALHLISHFPSTSINNVEDSEQEDDDGGILRVAIVELSKIIPWIVGGRKGIKTLLKTLLDLWSSAQDSVRIACFMAIRKIALAGDTTVVDLTLKGTYLTFIRTCKQSTVHSLPSINLMKNSAAELYNLDLGASYQQAFGYIRQLAILLRGAMKTKSKESYRQVYNWQYVHCVDFWSLVLSWSCDIHSNDMEMQPLIYPLVQIAIGSIRLVPTSRYFPLRFHMLRSLLRLSQRTGVYIPIANHLLEVFSSSEFKRQPKKSTLKPIDFESYIRVPNDYVRTKVYVEELAEELVYLLAESYLVLGKSISFPESIVPSISILKKSIKKLTSGPKVINQLKSLIERLEGQAKFIESQRSKVEFTPGERGEIDRFLEDLNVENTTLGTFVKILRKGREQKRKESYEIEDEDLSEDEGEGEGEDEVEIEGEAEEDEEEEMDE